MSVLPRGRKLDETHCGAAFFPQDNCCLRCRFILKPVPLTLWKTLDAVKSGLTHPARREHTSADGNWCLGFPIEGQVADYIQDQLTRIEQQTKPQITELHMPSDNNSHPHTHTLARNGEEGTCWKKRLSNNKWKAAVKIDSNSTLINCLRNQKILSFF